MSEPHRITFDPAQCGGRPCPRGPRIRVRDVPDLLAAGAAREEILEDFPLLQAGDITAALEYAADPRVTVPQGKTRSRTRHRSGTGPEPGVRRRRKDSS